MVAFLCALFIWTTNLTLLAENGPPQPLPEEAIYNGSFDMVTMGHRTIMLSALDKNIRKLWIGVNVSGSKDFKASFEERKAMIAKMLGPEAMKRVEIMPVRQDEKNAFADNLIGRTGVSTRTILGQDSYENLPGGPDKYRHRNFIVVPRPEQSEGQVEETPNVSIMRVPISGISSTLVRNKLLKGDFNIPELHPEVLEFVKERGLYRKLPPHLESIQKDLFYSAFDKFMSEARNPNKDAHLQSATRAAKWEKMKRPTFEPVQSQMGWGDKFVRMIIDQHEDLGISKQSAREIAAFTLKSLTLPQGESQEFPVLAFPYLQFVDGERVILAGTGNPKPTVYRLAPDSNQLPEELIRTCETAVSGLSGH